MSSKESIGTLFSLHRSDADADAATSSSYSQLHLIVFSDSQLAVVDQRGTVRILETGRSSLERCGVLACVVQTNCIGVGH